MRSSPQDPAGPVAVPRSSPEGKKRRIASIDVLRGLVVALMALDHTRDFFSSAGFNPRDVAEPALFLTRWVTHFCAPTFIFLAGLSAFLYGSGRNDAETSRFLLVRGLWLILIEFTLVRLGWTFDLSFLHDYTAGVIWVIGASMVALAVLVWLPRWAIAGVALVMIASHNLVDGIRAEQLGQGAALWHVLHQPGIVHLGDSVRVFVLYPLVPWIGVMAAGYALGPVMRLEPKARQRLLFGWARLLPSALSCCAPAMSMATPRPGPPRDIGWRRRCHSSIARNTRRLCFFS